MFQPINEILSMPTMRYWGYEVHQRRKLELRLNYYNVRFNTFKRKLSILMKPIINVGHRGREEN